MGKCLEFAVFTVKIGKKSGNLSACDAKKFCLQSPLSHGNYRVISYYGMYCDVSRILIGWWPCYLANYIAWNGVGVVKKNTLLSAGDHKRSAFLPLRKCISRSLFLKSCQEVVAGDLAMSLVRSAVWLLSITAVVAATRRSWISSVKRADEASRAFDVR